MCAFFLGPALAEAGAMLSEALLELGINNTVAAAGSAAVVSQVGTQINNAVASGLEAAAKQVLGQEVYDSSLKTAEDLQADASFVAGLLSGTGPSSTSQTSKSKTGTGAGPRTPSNNPGAQVSNIPSKSIGGINATIASSTDKPGPKTLLSTLISNASNNSAGPGSLTDKFVKTVKDSATEVATDLLTNAATNLLDSMTSPETKQTVIDQSKLLADLLTEHSVAAAENIGPLDVKKTIVELVGTDRSRLTMVQKLSDYYASKVVSDSPDYKRIKAMYTGRGLGPESTVMTETKDKWLFMFYDEVGRLETLVQEKSAKTLPPVYGVFGGPLSPNNRKPINYPDACFMAHDCDYQESYFSKEADLKLVARLLTRKDQWPVSDVSLLNSIIVYFQTVGKSISYLKGSLPGSVSTQVIEADTKDDIFPVLVDTPMTIEDYQIERYNFYKSFSDQMSINAEEKSVLARPTRIISKSLIDSFENITVEIK